MNEHPNRSDTIAPFTYKQYNHFADVGKMVKPHDSYTNETYQ